MDLAGDLYLHLQSGSGIPVLLNQMPSVLSSTYRYMEFLSSPGSPKRAGAFELGEPMCSRESGSTALGGGDCVGLATVSCSTIRDLAKAIPMELDSVNSASATLDCAASVRASVRFVGLADDPLFRRYC